MIFVGMGCFLMVWGDLFDSSCDIGTQWGSWGPEGSRGTLGGPRAKAEGPDVAGSLKSHQPSGLGVNSRPMFFDFIGFLTPPD